MTSRLGLVLGTEAMNLIDAGIASASAIDLAMRLGYNHPMGPLELADLVGLDARLNNLESLQASLRDDKFRPPRILRALVSTGYLGRKTGRGFYRYDARGRVIEGSGVETFDGMLAGDQHVDDRSSLSNTGPQQGTAR